MRQKTNSSDERSGRAKNVIATGRRESKKAHCSRYHYSRLSQPALAELNPGKTLIGADFFLIALAREQIPAVRPP